MWNDPSMTGPALLYNVTQLHGPEYCPGGSYCDCQHHLLDKPISP
jgi:hypothetical protein